jgi:hypothetical protein
MKTNPFILFIAVCATVISLGCEKDCAEVEKDTENSIFFMMIDKTSRKNLLDYAVGNWTDSVRIYDIQNKKLVGPSPEADGSIPLTFFDEQLDADAFNTIKHKKFRINLQYSRDTIDVFFKMKRGHCDNIELESMQAKYKDSTYYANTTNTWISFVKP